MERKQPIQVIELASINVPSIKVKDYGSNKWVKYGEGNNFPGIILDHYNNSVTHKAIINTKANMIAGDGLALEDPEFRFNPKERPLMTLRKIAKDYALFNGFGIQVIKGSEGDNIAEIHHTDFSRWRAEKSEEFTPESYFFSRDWTHHSQDPNKPINVRVWNPDGKNDDRTIFYFFEDEPGVDYYPLPTYNAGFSDIIFEHEYSIFKASTVKNGMFPVVHVKVYDDPSEKEKDNFYNSLSAKFSGAANAGKLFITYGVNQEDHPELNPITVNGNSDLYSNWKEDCRQSIITAHQLTSPVLAGLSGSGNLSGNAQEINTAFEQFHNIYVNDKQTNLEDCLKDLLKHWHTDVDLDLIKIKSKRPVTEIPDIAFDVATDEQIRLWLTDMYGIEFDQELIEKEKTRACAA